MLVYLTGSALTDSANDNNNRSNLWRDNDLSDCREAVYRDHVTNDICINDRNLWLSQTLRHSRNLSEKITDLDSRDLRYTRHILFISIGCFNI